MTKQTHSLPRWRKSSLLFLAVSVVSTPLGFSATEPAKDEPKTHALFMGAEVQVLRDKNRYRVRNVSGGSVIIKIDGNDVAIPMDRGPVSLKIDAALKLTETAVTIDDLKSERAYTPENDPQRKMAASQIAVTSEMNNSVEFADWKLKHTPEKIAGPTGGQVDNPAYKSTLAAQQGAHRFNDSSATVNSSSYFVQKMHDELALKLFDAVDINFKVASEKPLKVPYVVFVAEFHEKDKPKPTQTWIYAKALDPIDARPTKVHILQGGFPPGFELEKLHLHLYNDGIEVDTNVAEKRVLLTRDEALQYVVIDYMTHNKGATLQATPAMAKFPADWESRPKGEAFLKTYYVKVDKTGHPTAAYEDDACSKNLDDAYVESVIMDARFRPALAQGKPIESVAQLKLADLPR